MPELGFLDDTSYPQRLSPRSDVCNGRTLVVGDSHSCFWLGDDRIQYGLFRSKRLIDVDILHIGPVTAHQVGCPTRSHESFYHLDQHLRKMSDRYEQILFSFGEIDCRCHIVRLAKARNVAIRDVAETTAYRYFAMVQHICEAYQQKGIIWGPTPSSPSDESAANPAFPLKGSHQERNHATFLLGNKLADLCRGHKDIHHIDIMSDITDVDGATRAEYLYDGCHLSSLYFEQAIDKVRACLPSNVLKDGETDTPDGAVYASEKWSRIFDNAGRSGEEAR